MFPANQTQHVRRIVTHVSPHLDEIFGIWLLRRYGMTVFPGIETAPVEYWQDDMKTRTWQEHETEGTLLIGIGGGRFDEHTTETTQRKNGHCAASLVAEALNLSKIPSISPLLDYVMNDDLKGSRNPFDLASVIVRLHRSYPLEPQRVIDWANLAIESDIKLRERFVSETADAFAQAVITVVTHNGKRIKIATITTDDPQIPAFSRTAAGGRIALCIVRTSTGNISVLSNTYDHLNLTELCRLLRIEEYKVTHTLNNSWRWKDFEGEGKVPLAPNWFYFKEGEHIFNGGLTHPDVPPTLLTLERVKELAVIAFENRSFEPERENTCRSGICTNKVSLPCPWYDFGLKRCRTIRFKQFHDTPTN
jgi:hypothetical protein